jgi:hypothetical protein
MSNGDAQRGNNSSYSNNRRGNYSPSASYNYNPASGNYSGQQQNSHPRRRTDRFKRQNIDLQDRLVKQNDTIIKLLKEIRDRLSPSGNSGQNDSHTATYRFPKGSRKAHRENAKNAEDSGRGEESQIRVRPLNQEPEQDPSISDTAEAGELNTGQDEQAAS